jgi:transcriptional regulator with XRE-family HTH domain
MEDSRPRALGMLPIATFYRTSVRLSRLPAWGVMPALFGAKLRYLRRGHKVTQVDLANKLGLASHTHVTKLEAGQRTASLHLVVRAANFFHVTTDYLLRDSIPVEEPKRRRGLVTPGSLEAIEGLQRFGATLRSQRLRSGLSQADFARQLGLARHGYISNLETGRKAPSLDLAVQIADLFGVATDFLFYSTLPTDSEG